MIEKPQFYCATIAYHVGPSALFGGHNSSQRLRKMTFYCVNTSYPIDNSLSGRRGPARQMSEKDVLCLHWLGRPSTVHSLDGVLYFLPV